MSQTPSSPPPNFAEPRKKKRSPDSLEALLADLPVLDAPADLVPKSENGATFGRGAAALAGVAGLGFLGLTAVFSYRRSLQRHLKDEAEKRAGGSGTAARPAAAGSARNAAAGAINLKAAPPAPIDPKVLAMAHTVARRALMYSFLISGGMFVVGVGVIAWSMDVQSLGDVKARAAAALRPIRDGVGGGVAPAVRRIAEKPAGWLASLFRGNEPPQDTSTTATASSETPAAAGVAALPALQGVAPAGGDGATELLDSPAMRELHPAEQRDVYRLVAWVQRQMEIDADGSGSGGSGTGHGTSPSSSPVPAPSAAAASSSAAGKAAVAAQPTTSAAVAAADNAGRLR